MAFNPDELASRRRQTRHEVNRRVAWLRHRKTAAQQGVSGSPGRAYNKLEAELARLMDDWAIDYEWQLRLGPYVYDFRLPGQVLVEVQGGYWHPDPKRCDPAAMPGEQWERLLRDMAKSRYASQRGYRLITVWERDLRAGRVTRESLAAGAALPGGSKGP